MHRRDDSITGGREAGRPQRLDLLRVVLSRRHSDRVWIIRQGHHDLGCAQREGADPHRHTASPLHTSELLLPTPPQCTVRALVCTCHAQTRHLYHWWSRSKAPTSTTSTPCRTLPTALGSCLDRVWPSRSGVRAERGRRSIPPHCHSPLHTSELLLQVAVAGIG